MSHTCRRGRCPACYGEPERVLRRVGDGLVLSTSMYWHKVGDPRLVHNIRCAICRQLYEDIGTGTTGGGSWRV